MNTSDQKDAGAALRKARMLRVGDAWVADTATVTARVNLGAEANIWYGAVVRGDDAPIAIGERTNIQDNAVVHVDPDAANVIGKDVMIGHGAVCHGVQIEDYALIGMGAVLLSGSVIGEGAIVGAGSVVLENQEVGAYTVVVGSPARAVKTLDPEVRRVDAMSRAADYARAARVHAAGDWDDQVWS